MNDRAAPCPDRAGHGDSDHLCDRACVPRPIGARSRHSGSDENEPSEIETSTARSSSVPTDHDDDWRRGDPADIATIRTDAVAVFLDAFTRGRPSWHDQAACLGSDVDFTSRSKAERAASFDLCGRCEVREPCLDWAIDVDDQVAILGGHDPASRRRIAQQR